MIRNLKGLGLALIAALALGTGAVPSASAQFEAESTPVKVTRSANNTHVFEYEPGGAEVQCTTVGGSGEQSSSPVTAFRFDPTYTGCTVPGIGNAEVSMNGCGYTLTSAGGSTSASTHIVCPEGVGITITIKFLSSSVCTLHIKSQTPGGTIAVSNIGSGTTREVGISWIATGLSMTRTGSATCGLPTSSVGGYRGSLTGTGQNPINGTHIGIFAD